MAVDLLEGPKSKIERAYSHISDLDQRIKGFFQSEPYEIATQLDPDGTQEWFVVRKTKELPKIIPVIVGEVIYDLRSALDQLTCCLAKKAGRDCTDVYFPFAGSKQKFELKDTQGKIQKLHPDAVLMIQQLHPYKGGNDFLWSLNRLNNLDKHQSLIGAGTMGVQFNADLTMKPREGLNTIQALKTTSDPFKEEIKILSFPAGCKPEGKVNIAFDVAFRDVEIVERQSVLATLYQYANLVEKIISIFDDRFFKA